MIIQLNTDKNIEGNQRLEEYMSSLIRDELSRFSEHITRIEVHLADENGPNKGFNAMRCMIEARIENRQPIAVTSHADTLEKSMIDALDKMKATLEKIDGKIKHH
jgi:ribosome-associated translation inhibitor RaiA